MNKFLFQKEIWFGKQSICYINFFNEIFKIVLFLTPLPYIHLMMNQVKLFK